MASTMLAAPNDVLTLADELEQLWTCFDELFATLRPNDWSRQHGKH